MKMQVIGEARASTRSIFNIALVGVLLTFAGQAVGDHSDNGADQKSGYCEWPDDWDQSTTTVNEVFDTSEAVVGDTIRFNGADGAGTLTAFTFPAPLCDWDDDGDVDTDTTAKPTDFFNPSMKCGATAATATTVASGDNLFGTSTTALVHWAEDTSDPQLDGKIDLTTPNIATPTAAVTCTLSLDWVGSNDADGPIEWEFKVAIVPTPHGAPTNVHATAETYDSIYVEWDAIGPAVDATTDTTPQSYVIEYVTGTETPRTKTVKKISGTTDTAKRQGARITGLKPETEYTITVTGISGSGTTKNYGRKSLAAQSGLQNDDTSVTLSTVTTLKRYYKPSKGTDSTYKLSVGETVEIDATKYFMNLALDGRIIEGINDIDPSDSSQRTGSVDNYVRGSPGATPAITVNALGYAVKVANSKYVEAIHVSTDASTQQEDLMRLHGLADGRTTITLVATIGAEMISTQLAIMVIENHAPVFAVSEATMSWHVDKENPTTGSHVGLQIDVLKQFGYSVSDEDLAAGNCDDNASNDVNCDEELTYSLGSIPDVKGYVSYRSFFEITEDNESTGIITVKPRTTDSQKTAFENAVKNLDDGDEIAMRVTVEDASGGKDVIDLYLEVSTEGNFPPELARITTSNPAIKWLPTLSADKGGGTRTIDLTRSFTDPDGDALCYVIHNAGTTLGNDTETWATAELGRTPGVPGCDGAKLTLTMALPSTDPDDPGFALLGKYGREEVVVQVKARELKAADPVNMMSPATTVKVWVIYGPNAGPNIRDVALATGGSTYYATGNYKIIEGEDIKLTFTADDGQPNGDILCWNVSRGSCRATTCNGGTKKATTTGSYSDGFSRTKTWDSITASSRRSTAETNNGISHTYQMYISGDQPGFGFGAPPRTITDYETNDGVFSFNVCVTDLSGATDTLPFEVKLEDKMEKPVFSLPTSKNDIDVFMLVGDYSQTVTVKATDGDRDDITYAAAPVGSCPVKINMDAESGEVELTPPTKDLTNDEGKITCEIEIHATDGDFDVYTDPSHFTVTVKNENSAPTFASGLSAITYQHPENQRGTVGGKIRVSDADVGDVVSVELSPSSHFSASSRAVRETNEDAANYNEIIGYDISIAVKSSKIKDMNFEAAVNSFDLVLTAMDEYGGSASLDVRVDLMDVNEPPMLVKDEDGKNVEIEDQKILVGVEKCIAKARDLFFDPDHRDQQSGLFIEATTTRPGDASVTVKQNEHICITGHSVGSGAGRVKVTATDRDDKSVSLTFRVTVESNQPPTVVGDGIDDRTVQENGRTEDDIELTDFFDDGDIDYEEELTFSFSVDKGSIATGVLIDGTFLRIYGDSKGTTEVTVTATDQNDQSVDTTFEVEVVRNDPPVANADAFEDVEQYIGKEYDPIDAREAFTDEGDTLTYYVSTKNSDVATAAIKYDEDGGEWIVLNLHSPGTTSVTVTVYDSANNDASNSFDLTVLARNDPPMLVNAIEDVEVEEGAQHDVSLEDVFEDEGSLDYTVKNEDENIADVLYRASTNEIRIYANNTGTTTVVVVATDNIGQTASDEFDVTVVEPPPPAPTNAAPVLSGTLDDQTVTAGEPISVSIEGVFTDPDGDELTYTAESEDTDVATVDLANLELTISGVNAGSTVFKITATDGEFNVVGEFDVEVETIPVTVGTIPNQTLQIGGEGSSLSVGEFFFDQDGDVLTYTIETSGNAATVSLTDADVDMSPFTRGSTSVTITASDPKGRSATQTFSIAVSDDELRAAGLNALAGTARAYMGSTAAALGSRLESSRSDTGMGFGFGFLNRYMPVTGADAVDNSARVDRNELMGFNAKQDLLDATWNASTGQEVDFNFNLPTFDSLLTNNFSRTLNGNGGIGSWSIWGTIDAQNFEGEGYDGSANSAFLGIDVQTNECWIFGVTAARNTSEGDYSWGTATQSLETKLTTILPYFSYEPIDGKTSVWGVYGRGSGDAETTVVNAAAESSDLSFNVAMFGGRREFAKAGSLQLAFRGDAAFANLETDEGRGAIADLSAGVNRIRAGIEGSFSVDTGNGGKVTPFGELAFRNDGGDGQTGNGFEVAGGVRVDTNTITIEARGRWLATHSAEDFSESGVSLMLNINPSSDASGLSFSLTPQWGSTSESSKAVWANTAQNLSAAPYGDAFGTSNGLSLNSKLAYGFALNHGKYLLTPYVDVQDTGWYGKTVMIGTELMQLTSGPRSMNMKMFLSTSDDGVDQVAPQLGLQALFTF